MGFTGYQVRSGEAASWRDVPVLDVEDLREAVVQGVAGGLRLAAFFARRGDGPGARLVAVLADDRGGMLSLLAGDAGERYPALTPDCPQAHLFEREIAEQSGVVPEGHPWLKPVRYGRSWRPGVDAWGRPADADLPPAVTDFYRVEGEPIHEVAVGPVHAGVIEPGHFRFQCHGEDVLHLEIALGFQHRGVERALRGGPDRRSIHYAETLAGDTTIGHATAYCRVVEALTGAHPPAAAEALRGVALELERLANHAGDLGALAGDVGFLPTQSYCGRIRGDFLNMTALLCGSRFGRGLVRPGGAAFAVEGARRDELLRRLDAGLRDVTGAVDLLWQTPSVAARFEGTGVVAPDVCAALGLVGPAARACGRELDVRQDHPDGIYRFAHVPVATWHTGDVFGRAFVRWLEIQRSIAFARDTAAMLGPAVAPQTPRAPAPESVVVSLVEGWRGEICHVAITDAAGRFADYKVVDPSFHNWTGLAMALRDQAISDFPLCNKSFNLSYCGHDL